jgi:hypothetical protein
MMTPIRRAAMWTALAVLVAGLVSPLSGQSQTASQFYESYRVAYEKATKIADLLPFMSKTTNDQVAATPEGDRDKMFGLMKMMGATDVRIVKEAKTAEGATLSVEGIDADKKKITGEVKLVKENGAWKLDSESWKSSS